MRGSLVPLPSVRVAWGPLQPHALFHLKTGTAYVAAVLSIWASFGPQTVMVWATFGPQTVWVTFDPQTLAVRIPPTPRGTPRQVRPPNIKAHDVKPGG